MATSELCASVEEALKTVELHFSVAMGDAARVQEALARLGAALASLGPEDRLQAALRLLPLLTERKGPLARLLFQYLEGEVPRGAEPNRLLAGMLASRDQELQARAFDLSCSLAEEHRFVPDSLLLVAIARLVEREDSPFRSEVWLQKAGALVRRLDPSRLPVACEDAVVALFLAGSPALLRCLAARILDAPGEPAAADRAARLLGSDAAFLAPYLEYTRASHRDLVDLTPDPSARAPSVDSLRTAERVLGRVLLCRVLAEFGWSSVVWGITVEAFTGVSFDGSYPFVLHPHEAALLEDICPSRRHWLRFVIVAHGGTGKESEEGVAAQTVQRFRRYNVAHAEVLTELLEVAPLTEARVLRLVEHMDRIVEDFTGLFGGDTEDAAHLPALYAALRAKVLAAVKASDSKTLSAEVTRLVQVFEDPRTLEEVRTMHGLKRYLHQQGLRLAFRLFRSGSATNRSVDVAIANEREVTQTVRRIRYLDFEPEAGLPATQLPLVVQMAVDGFVRQLLAGRDTFPGLQLLIYGNEVQVYAGFRNHPAFLRLDFSPPLRGGLIDLEYFAVSQYEMDQHPDLSLQAIQQMFRRLGFNVSKDGFRLRARYDRERAFHFGDITHHARLLFCLVPYLMDVDWMIGNLDYPEPARAVVAKAWADFFLAWGVLPGSAILTSDGRRILQDRIPGPAGEQEIPWNGAAPYRDIHTGRPGVALIDLARRRLLDRGFLFFRHASFDGSAPAQMAFEEEILQPLQDALLRGEAQEKAGGIAPVSPKLYEPEHEAVRLARVLAEAGDAYREAVATAGLVSFLERQLPFHHSGMVQGCAVQRAELHLRRERLGLYVLRDADGAIALAMAVPGGGALYRRRDSETGPWIDAPAVGELDLAVRLRKDNYMDAGYVPAGGTEQQMEEIRSLFRAPQPRAAKTVEGERCLPAVPAAPGAVTAPVLFARPGRVPSDFEGFIFAAPVVSPQDAPFIVRSAGVLTTGGGTLSHAGLVALELQKPAVIVAGRWKQEQGKPSGLCYRLPVFAEEEARVGAYDVVCRREQSSRDEDLCEGDVVSLDADEAALTVLGRDAETLSLLQGIRVVEDAYAGLERVRDERETLALRGRILHARHQIERTLARTASPVIAKHAVRELLAPTRSEKTAVETRARLLQALFSNPRCCQVARETARYLAARISDRYRVARKQASAVIPLLSNVYELVYLQFNLGRMRSLLDNIEALLGESASTHPVHREEESLEAAMTNRMRSMEQQLRSKLASGSDPWWMQLRLRDQAERIDAIRKGGAPAAFEPALPATAAALSVLKPEDGGIELSAAAGRKAANLGEISRILGSEAVPPWFAVTDLAFRAVLTRPVATGMLNLPFAVPERCSLRQAIECALRWDQTAERKASWIRQLWSSIELPDDLAAEVRAGCDRLGRDVPVAVRSSAFAEDTDQTAFAGQFDTFLYVRGPGAVIEHLKLAWAGLWNERAIHMRSLLGGDVMPSGGGVIVQKMVNARISGVIHTVSVATGRMDQIAINAGLGLGEGVVSGTVDVDHIFVEKASVASRGELRFRYRVGDKREQVVLNTAAGHGTCRAETQYHQRFRPALEYTELCDLVEKAIRLETACGEPLDIEFACEDQSMFILQMRPIGVFHAALSDFCNPASGIRGASRESHVPLSEVTS